MVYLSCLSVSITDIPISSLKKRIQNTTLPIPSSSNLPSRFQIPTTEDHSTKKCLFKPLRKHLLNSIAASSFGPETIKRHFKANSRCQNQDNLMALTLYDP